MATIGIFQAVINSPNTSHQKVECLALLHLDWLDDQPLPANLYLPTHRMIQEKRTAGNLREDKKPHGSSNPKYEDASLRWWLLGNPLLMC